MIIMDIQTGEYISDLEGSDKGKYIDGYIEFLEAKRIRDGFCSEGVKKYSTITAIIQIDGVLIEME